ncbi:MAG: sodium/glutamate symporter [Gammaproteobacteria bacterium]|nr:sodium/glutamate symporter [Gammaproteobacteria bacterium]
MEIEVENLDVLIVAILVLFLGRFLTGKIKFLDHYNIPPAVTGGIICSLLVAVLEGTWDIRISFDLQLRDLFLLFFFSTIGLGAKLNVLTEGGKTMVKLVLIAAVLLVLQNITGVGLAMLAGGDPGYGLLAGSISFAGGHGTAIAWGQEAIQAGLQGAEEFAVACATFGLIAGGLIGGPVGGWLINRYQLSPASGSSTGTSEVSADNSPGLLHIDDVLGTLLVLAICVTSGDLVNRFLSVKGFSLPGFLTAMMVGILITNISDVLKKPLNRIAIDRAGELSLELFLAMSLMSMQLLSLLDAAGPIITIVLAQTLLTTLVAVYLVFITTGKNYDSAVMASGFCGLGLGATPVAIANMTAITGKFGPSPRAFLVIPLVGAFFIDLLNALVIKFFLILPFFTGS